MLAACFSNEERTSTQRPFRRRRTQVNSDLSSPRSFSERLFSPSALTIAADKGHHKFVELLLQHGATIDVRNKKGATPLWLASNSGHLEVVQLLIARHADPDACDSRKVSCLMAAFRKGHIKVVKYLVRQVRQFPSDADCRRLITTINDKVRFPITSICADRCSSP